MKLLLLLLVTASPSLSSCATTQKITQEQSVIKKHRDRLVYLVNATAQQAGAYVISISWNPEPTDFTDFATVTLVYPSSRTEVYVFVRERDVWDFR